MTATTDWPGTDHRRPPAHINQPTAPAQPVVTPAPTVGPAPAGRHRWDKGGPLDRVGRRLITNPVDPTWWPPQVPRRRDTDTAPMLPVPANLHEVLAELRADLERAA